MFDWWDRLNGLQMFFYFIAVPSTVILFLQTILSLIGFGLDGDVDMDMDSDVDGGFDFDHEAGFHVEMDSDGQNEFDAISGLADFRFVTTRGIIAFLTMFGWVGAAFAKTDAHPAFAIFFALIAGLLSMLMIASLFYGISKLQSSGNINYRLAIGHEAQVYIPIPAEKKGHGKVQIMLQERLIEVDAITDTKDTIGTGETVRIIDMLNATTFLVERL